MKRVPVVTLTVTASLLISHKIHQKCKVIASPLAQTLGTPSINVKKNISSQKMSSPHTLCRESAKEVTWFHFIRISESIYRLDIEDPIYQFTLHQLTSNLMSIVLPDNLACILAWQFHYSPKHCETANPRLVNKNKLVSKQPSSLIYSIVMKKQVQFDMILCDL